MSFWSGEKLIANPQVISDFSPDRVDCNSYTLRMGHCYYRTADSEAGAEQTKRFLKLGEPFTIPAGQFGFLLSKETVSIPAKSMAFISMRTGIKWQGLINVSGFHVDPGYQGKLIYAVYNASPSPVQICEDEPIFKIWFADLDRPSEGRFLFPEPGLTDIPSALIRGMSKEILSLQSLADKIRETEKKISDSEAAINAKLAQQQPTIDNLTFIWRAIIIGVLGVAFAAFMAFSLPILWQTGQLLVQSLWPHQITSTSPTERPATSSVAPAVTIAPPASNPVQTPAQ